MFYSLFYRVTTQDTVNFVFFCLFICFTPVRVCFYHQKLIFSEMTAGSWSWSFICSFGLIAAAIYLDKHWCARYNKLNYLIISVLIVIAFTQN